jgi:hypothetical protein
MLRYPVTWERKGPSQISAPRMSLVRPTIWESWLPEQDSNLRPFD